MNVDADKHARGDADSAAVVQRPLFVAAVMDQRALRRLEGIQRRHGDFF